MRRWPREIPPPDSLIHHSDRGVQYACADYVERLEARGVAISMSRPGNPYDNAKAESFMKTLKTEEVNGKAYANIEDARRQIGAFIETVYNRQRLHSALGYKPPVEFEADCAGRANPKPGRSTVTQLACLTRRVQSSGMSRNAAARRFGVSIASAIRWVWRFQATGEISPAPTGGDRRSNRIEAHRDYLLGLIRRQPDVTLLEIQERLIANSGERFSSSVIWRFFDRHEITFKKRPRMPRSSSARTS